MTLGETVGRIKTRSADPTAVWGRSDFRDSQIGKARYFLTWCEVLEAAGLRE